MRLGAPTGASYQILQTRAKLTAHLLFQIAMAVLLLWAGFTAWVVWHATGTAFPQLNHAYFVRWALCSLLSPIYTWAKIPVDGSWYPMPQFAAWVDSQQMYGASFGTWFTHYAWRTALIPIGIGVFAIGWKVRHRVDDAVTHLRGLRLLSPREHNRQLNGGVITRLANDKQGIELGSVTIPFEKLPEHIEIAGSPGSGKSTLIRHILRQIEERGDSAIVVDVECEFLAHFYKPERQDVILNMLDSRCCFWSPWMELRDGSFPTDAEAMAASLIRGHARNSTEDFFLQSSRSLLEAMFEVVQDRSGPQGLTEFLTLSRVEIQQALRGTKAYPLIDPGAHEQGSGILASTANAIKPFTHLPRRDEADRAWSAREWAASPTGWVFLSSTESGRAATQRLQGVLLDCLVGALMEADINTERRVWVICDELPAMGYQNQILDTVCRGRKRGIVCVLGYQSVSQLRAIYGHDSTVALTSSPSTKALLRIDDSESAKWASDLLGSRELARTEMTMLAGLSNYREGVNLQERRSTEHIVTAAEVQLLKPLTAYLAVAGHDRTMIEIPPFYMQRNQPGFVPRRARYQSTNTTGTYDAC